MSTSSHCRCFRHTASVVSRLPIIRMRIICTKTSSPSRWTQPSPMMRHGMLSKHSSNVWKHLNNGESPAACRCALFVKTVCDSSNIIARALFFNWKLKMENGESPFPIREDSFINARIKSPERCFQIESWKWKMENCRGVHRTPARVQRTQLHALRTNLNTHFSSHKKYVFKQILSLRRAPNERPYN